MTTIHIGEETHKKLMKIKGAMIVDNGKEKSFDDVINLLIQNWHQTRKRTDEK